jgi:HK97 family phage prohead protease
MPPPNAALERRKYESRATVEGPPGRPVIRGYAIVFNEPSLVLGAFMGGEGFQEIIRPQAIERTFREKIDVRAFIDHDSGRVLGRLRPPPPAVPTLRLSTDRHGLLVEIDPDVEIPEHASLLRSIRRGDISGQSFSFQTMADGESWNHKTTPSTRELTDMRVFEVSVVAMPAYEQTDVEVALRSRARALGQVPTVAQLQETSAAKAAAWKKR